MKQILLLFIILTSLSIRSQCYSSIASKTVHNMAIKPDGTLWAWGQNDYYQLGVLPSTDRPTAVQVGTDSNWSNVFVGTLYTLALKEDGTLWSWGSNSYGQTGNGGSTTPLIIGSDTDWVTAAAGLAFSAAIKSDGTLWMWGYNDYGQLGNGTTTNSSVPGQVGTDTDWMAVSLGAQFTLALKTDGTLWAWGLGEYGNLGLGNYSQQHTPMQVGSSNDWVKIWAGYSNSYAIKADGTLWAWGSNTFGGVGNGSSLKQNTPLQIGNDTWKSVTATHHVLAVKTDGTLWSWGRNVAGEVGNGNIGLNQSVPVQVGTATDWKRGIAGWNHSIAVKNDNSVWTWGDNEFGTLGDGTFNDNPVPTQIGTPCDQVLCTVSPNAIPDFAAACSVALADLALPTMTDTCGNTVTPTLMIGSFPITEQGTTTIVWQYDTSSGLVTATQNIVLSENTAPVPQTTVLADLQAQCEVTAADITIPLAMDTCSGVIEGTTTTVFPVTAQGTTPITWTYSDNAGNMVTQTQNIIIADTTAPVVNVETLPMLSAQCAIANITPPTATDACVGAITATTNDSLSYSTQGNYVITWTYNDGNGNTISQIQDVIIEDTIAPEAVAQDLTVDLAGEDSVSIIAEQIENGSSDNCGAFTLSLDTDTFTDIGEYPVTLTVTDASGNVASSIATVTVIDSLLNIAHLSNRSIAIYPVPVNDVLFIDKPDYIIITKIEVYDTVGRLVSSYSENSEQLDLSHLDEAHYYISITTDHGSLKKNIIIKR